MDTGSLLQLMHDAANAWETFQAECREWRHTQRGFEAFARALRSRGQTHSTRGPSETDDAEAVETVRLWVGAGMRRIRQETILPDGRTIGIVVVDGDRWWLFNPRQGVLRHHGGDSHSVGTFDVASFLDPAAMIPHLEFGRIGAGDEGGRACWVVDATPRDQLHSARWSGSRLPEGADHYRLWIDEERGVALRIEALWQGEPFSIREATGVIFDAALPDELFDYRPPAGAPEFSTHDELDVREVTIEEAAEAAPFTVLIPARLPGAMTIQVVHYAVGGGFSGAQPSVMLLARDHQGGYVTVEETAAVGEEQGDGDSWQVTQRRGTTFRTRTDGRRATVRLVLHGTRVQLSGPVDLTVLFDMAESLKPAAFPPTHSGDAPG